MIPVGKLDKRIQLHSPSLVDDGYSETYQYQLNKTVWANAYYVSDMEKYRAGAVNVDANIRFTIRKTEISRDWRIVFNGKTYSIVGMKPSLGNEQFLELTCGELAEGG